MTIAGMADEAAVWDALPEEEHQQIWDDAERKFWQDFNQAQEDQRLEADQGYQRTMTEAKIELGMLEGKRHQLNEDRDRLMKVLSEAEKNLANVVEECDEQASKLTALERDYRAGEQDRLEKREQVVRTMIRWFRQKRGEDVPSDDSMGEADDGLSGPDRDPLPMEGVQHTGEDRMAPTQSVTPVNSSPTPALDAEVLVNVTDADGRVIGPVKRIDPWNQWVKAVQDLPIRRSVRIRRGRKFNQDHLATIYDRSEAKGVKWLSCMIQAIGDIQGQRCHSCDKNQGAFDDCIVIGGPLFQKCGNCEWNRQGCHGAEPQTGENSESPHSQEVQAVTEQIDGAEAMAQERAELRAQRRQAAEEALAKAAGLTFGASQSKPEDGARGSRAHNGRHTAAQYDKPPTTLQLRESLNGTGGFTPANVQSRPASRGALTPNLRSVEASPLPADLEDLEPITLDSLTLKHDGHVYTYPEILEGVPLEKIDESHPYWDPKWPNVQGLTETALQQWKEKFEVAREAKERGEKGGTAKFQLGRQVNRGQKILEFLESGPINPYQFLGKKFTHSGKGSIASYDTLFRLAETLSELSKYGLDVEPLDWMRQRMHELHMELGSAFNVSRIIHNFYNDPKLSELRSKAGFKSIGRPSGAKTSRPSLGSTFNETPRKKLKTSQSAAGTPVLDHERLSLGQRTPQMDDTLLAQSPAEASEQVAGFSDTDSSNGATPGSSKFLIQQIKSRLYTSNAWVPQRLSWSDSAQRLEHLTEQQTEHHHPRDRRLSQWKLSREVGGFHIAQSDVAEVIWNVDSLRVYLAMGSETQEVLMEDGKPRGDIIVAFKSAKAVLRFVKFCRSKSLKIVQDTQ